MRCLPTSICLLLLGTLSALAAPPLSFLNEERPHHHSRRVEINPLYRLPDTFKPVNYNLKIRPILDEDEGFTRFTAPGTVQITMLLVNKDTPGNTITLNSATIEYEEPEMNIKVMDLNKTVTYAVTSFQRNETSQLITITVDKNFDGTSDLYMVEIPFIAPMPPGNETAFGMYRTSYQTEDGETRYLAITDFESVDARRMTPCFDEPHLKATWTIQVERKNAYHSLSNMPIRQIKKLDENWEIDIYDTSVSMSTYLIAIGVSDYKSETAQEGLLPDKPVKVWGPPPMMEQGGGEYAPDYSAQVLKFLEDTFEEPYALDKMDKMAIPDFSAGAMENWGLNTYRIVRLLWFNGESTIQDKVSLSDTVAHELVHQWFGDLVTMQWWDDIWLNEGSATYWSSVAANAVHPEYRLNEFFVYDSVQTALGVDVNNMHALHYAGLQTPAETRYGFDTISYDKGASILRMVNATFGQEKFIQGLRGYLDKHAYGNANQDELFEALSIVPDLPLPPSVTVKAFMDTWTTQGGFPVITVTRDDSVVPAKITISQRHYLNDTSDRKWYVPVEYYDGTSGPSQSKWVWLSNDGSSAEITGPADQYVIVNPEQKGYYRVQYDQKGLDLIKAALDANASALHEQTRSALIDDNLRFAFDGQQDLKSSLALLSEAYLSKEDKLVAWASFSKNMAKPYSLLRTTGSFFCFRKYVQKIVEPTLIAIGFDPSDQDNADIGNRALLRNRLFEWACNVDHPACVAKSKEWVDAWKNNPNEKPEALKLQPDLRPFAYCAAMANANVNDRDALFAFLFDEYVKTERDVDQASLLRGLACTKDRFLLNKLIQLALNGTSTVRAAHRVVALQAVASNSVGAQVIFDSLRNGLDGILEAWGSSVVTSVVSSLSGVFTTETRLRELGSFVDENRGQLCPGTSCSLDSSLNTVRSNIQWLGKHYETFSSWLDPYC